MKQKRINTILLVATCALLVVFFLLGCSNRRVVTTKLESNDSSYTAKSNSDIKRKIDSIHSSVSQQKTNEAEEVEQTIVIDSPYFNSDTVVYGIAGIKGAKSITIQSKSKKSKTTDGKDSAFTQVKEKRREKATTEEAKSNRTAVVESKASSTFSLWKAVLIVLALSGGYAAYRNKSKLLGLWRRIIP